MATKQLRRLIYIGLRSCILLALGVALALSLGPIPPICAKTAPGALTPPQVEANTGQPLIRLQFATFDPAQGKPDMPEHLKLADYPGKANTYIVQFQGPVEAAWKEALAAVGAKIDGYLPDYAFLVRMDEATRARVEKLDFVHWVGIYHPAYKISPKLGNSPIDLYWVHLASWADAAEIYDRLKSLGATVSGSGTSLIVNAPFNQLAQIAQLPDVLWIEEYRFPEKLNDVATGIMNAPTVWDLDYTGEGQIIAVADTGLDTGVDDPSVNDDIHRDFDNRVAQISSWPVVPVFLCTGNSGADDGAADVASGHGTHVAGSVGGNGARSSGQYKGPAYGATLTFQAVEQYTEWILFCVDKANGWYLTGIPHDLNELFQEAYDWGARIHTNSWGAANAGEYTERSLDADEFTWNNRDFTLLFAAGNSGVDADSDGFVDEDSIDAPATAKNVISVGAVDNERNTGGLQGTWYQRWSSDYPTNPTRGDHVSDSREELAAFSGRGPTDDGRIKPDLVAPGTNILSARSSQATGGKEWGTYDEHYWYMGGTSQAAPLAAGAAAIVREYLVEDEGHTNPSSALIKAILINSAVDIDGYGHPSEEAGQPIPNSHEGWGRIDLAAATNGTNRTLVDDSSLTTNITHTFSFTVTSPLIPLKVSLVWTDNYSSTLAASRQLVNNLNLKVTDPGGTIIYYGNNFGNGWSEAFGSPDDVNNVENVYVRSPAPGVWTIEVIGFNIPYGPQPYALVVSGQEATLTEVGRIDGGPAYQAIHADGEAVYGLVYDSGWLEIVDASDPANPSIRSSLDLPFDDGHDLWYGEWEANQYVFTGHRFGGVAMVDVADPDAPVIVSTADTTYHHKGLQTVGRYLYYSEHPVGGTQGGLRIYDFGDGTLAEVGYHLRGEPCQIDGNELAVRSDGNRVYQYDDRKGVWDDLICGSPNEKALFYDTTDKGNPAVAGSFVPPMPRDWVDYPDMVLSPDDRYLYLALESNGVLIYDLSVPSAPTLIATVDETPVYEIALDSEKGVLYASGAPSVGSLYVIDVRDPANPRILSAMPGIAARDLWLDGDYLYATTEEAKLIILTPQWSGKIVVSHDEWPLSDEGFPPAPDGKDTNVAQFALNVANWFAGTSGNFLVHSVPFQDNTGLVGSRLASTMASADYTWTVSTTLDLSLPNLLQYDGVFLAGTPTYGEYSPPDPQVLIDYVRAGGNVYLAGGTDATDPAGEAYQWNPFLQACGLDFAPTSRQNNISGTLQFSSSHPIFAGVQRLYQRNGSFIRKLDPWDPGSAILVRSEQDEGLYAVCSIGTPVESAPTLIELLSFTAQAGADHVTLAWETASEVDNAGFSLRRSEAAEGAYVQINETLIPAEGDEIAGASYTYTDTDVVKGVTYYYKLEDVDIHGVGTFHGPVSATPGRIHPVYLPLVLK